MIVAGESSGELYGALLTSNLKSLWPDVRVIGVGGERMQQAGAELFEGIASSFGFAEALSTLKTVKETLRRTLQAIRAEQPDVVVLIDYPDFNFRVGRAARNMGVKVLYYVSPQVWAWRSGRIRTMTEVADRIAVLLPFEEGLYREVGMYSEFVGHPILDEINLLPDNPVATKKALGFHPEQPLIALLPGSRPHELRRLLPVMLGALRRFKREHPDHGFVMPLAPNMKFGEFRDTLDELQAEGVKIGHESAVMALKSADAAIIASGTAALQAAFVGTPLVVVYKVFPITYLIAKMLIINVKYISLVNLLLDRPVVKELLQGGATPEAVSRELARLTDDEAYRERMLENFEDVRRLFEGKRPSMRVSEMVGEMAGWEV